MAAGKQFGRNVSMDAPIRSHGLRKRYRGRMVQPNGYPREESVPAGGNAPRFDKRRGRKHTKWARRYWERNGVRAQPPIDWSRGYQ